MSFVPLRYYITSSQKLPKNGGAIEVAFSWAGCEIAGEKYKHITTTKCLSSQWIGEDLGVGNNTIWSHVRITITDAMGEADFILSLLGFGQVFGNRCRKNTPSSHELVL